MVMEQINQDLKAAMLSRDTPRVDTLKGLKTAVQYADVEARSKGESLSEEAITAILQKEAKKRTESADLYRNAGETERADKEMAEKAIIDVYLPKQLGEDEIRALIAEASGELGGLSQQTMGQVIGAVKAKSHGAADGGTVARLVKESLGQ